MELQSDYRMYRLIGHSSSVKAVACTPDGKHVVSGSSDSKLILWDGYKGDAICSFWGDSSIHACAISSDGQTIIAGDNLGQVYFLQPIRKGT